MPYLFESVVEKALGDRPGDADVLALQTRCQSVTAKLLTNYPRVPLGVYLLDDRQADARIASMGTQGKRDPERLDFLADLHGAANVPATAAGRAALAKADPHAADAGYVESGWQLLSGNFQLVTDKVAAEKKNAYDLGLDIRRPEVVGKMFSLAASVFRTIDGYVSRDDSNRR